MGSITYIGTRTKSIIECLKKYDIDVAIKRCKTMFDKIKNSNTEEIPILQKSGVYKLKCKDCSKLYIGETGRKFECRLADHKRGEGNRTSSSLYARHFVDENHRFVNPLEEYEIVKVEQSPVERKLRDELEILKERKKNLNSLINSKAQFKNEDMFYHILSKIEI